MRSALIAGLVGMALLVAPSGAQAILADASCPGPADSAPLSVLGDRREAQTFTVLHTGALQRATIEIDNLNAADPDFLLQILPTDANGVPVDGALASATIPKASVPAGAATLDVSFSPGANVIAGHRYAIAVSRQGGNFLVPGWDLHTRNAGACDGSSFFSSGPNAGWAAEPAPVDFIFQTFVNPANKFSIVSKGGKLYAREPGPGSIVVDDVRTVQRSAATEARKRKKKSKRLVRRFTTTAQAAGDVEIFTPTGGDPNTNIFTIKIRI